ncbi:hypothetical protein ACS79_15450 [Vibrio lentus]|nr:hypothetical protein ACS79_15450 [Vibrio lentus]
MLFLPIEKVLFYRHLLKFDTLTFVNPNDLLQAVLAPYPTSNVFIIEFLLFRALSEKYPYQMKVLSLSPKAFYVFVGISTNFTWQRKLTKVNNS